MSSNTHPRRPITLNRRQHDTVWSVNQWNITDVHNYLHRPTIDSIEPGMMIRAWLRPGPENKEVFGTIVHRVNKEDGTVDIRDNIGGTKEFIRTVPVSEVQQVWKIGTEEYALGLIDAFNAVVRPLGY